MRRTTWLNILAFFLGCMAAALWSHAEALQEDAWRWTAAAMWLLSAAAMMLQIRWLRNERVKLVHQLREAAAAIRPGDTRFQVATDARSFGAAVDGLIAASRAQSLSDGGRLRELELSLKSAVLERDDALAAVARLSELMKSLETGGASAQVAAPPRTESLDVVAQRELNRLKGELVTLISHRFRTPLASIRAYAEMLLDGEATDEQSRSEFYRIIQSEADRLGEVIGNILSLAGIDAGLVKPNYRIVPADRLAERALSDLRSRAVAKGVHLGCDFAADDEAVVRVDPELIALALGNIADNAVKFTTGGGTVLFRTIIDSDCQLARILIVDTGDGLKPVRGLPVLRDASSALAAGVGETPGLGVVVAHRIVERIHSGRLILMPGSTSGVIAEVSLPLFKDAAAARPVEVQS